MEDSPLTLVDSHAHLEGEQFDTDREQVIARAREAGVQTILAIGNGDNIEAIACGARLAARHDFIYATLGIHPHEASAANEALLAEMEQLARQPKVIAWGEIGLDYYYESSPREIQRRIFLQQMELARSVKLPIVIHCRPSQDAEDAWNDCLGMMETHWAASGLGGILHCFTGNTSHAKRALDMGFMVSFSGNVTFPKAQSIRDVALYIPMEKMLIETDSPFLAPLPNRGKRNEPAFVRFVAQKMAELREMPLEEVSSSTARNFYRFFSLHENLNSI